MQAFTCVYLHLCNLIDIKVNFNQTIHYFNESDESVLLRIVLTRELYSANVSVYIEESSGSKSTRGKCT